MALVPDFAKIRCVILDFDGVVIDSSGIKTEAFRTTYERYEGVVDEAMRYHVAHKGTSRFKQFDHVARNVLRSPDPEATVREMCEVFAKIAFEKVLHAPFVPGAPEFLRLVAGRFPVHVVSSAPHDELDAIVRARGLAGSFTSYRGGADAKEEDIRRIAAQEGLAPEAILYVGDTLKDLAAAEKSGVAFCGVRNALVDFSGAACLAVSDLRDLAARFGDAA